MLREENNTTDLCKEAQAECRSVQHPAVNGQKKDLEVTNEMLTQEGKSVFRRKIAAFVEKGDVESALAYAAILKEDRQFFEIAMRSLEEGRVAKAIECVKKMCTLTEKEGYLVQLIEACLNKKDLEGVFRFIQLYADREGRRFWLPRLAEQHVCEGSPEKAAEIMVSEGEGVDGVWKQEQELIVGCYLQQGSPEKAEKYACAMVPHRRSQAFLLIAEYYLERQPINLKKLLEISIEAEIRERVLRSVRAGDFGQSMFEWIGKNKSSNGIKGRESYWYACAFDIAMQENKLAEAKKCVPYLSIEQKGRAKEEIQRACYEST